MLALILIGSVALILAAIYGTELLADLAERS